jgi:hypothetical protein
VTVTPAPMTRACTSACARPRGWTRCSCAGRTGGALGSQGCPGPAVPRREEGALKRRQASAFAPLPTRPRRRAAPPAGAS